MAQPKTALTSSAPPAPLAHEGDYFARHTARLLIALYTVGEPALTLTEGAVRHIGSRAQLAHFDFWLREPGHLALALLHLKQAGLVAGREAEIAAAITRMTADSSVDQRRVEHPTVPTSPAYLDPFLVFLAGAALLSDRPSFTRGRSSQLVLEAAGIAFVEKLFEECPSLGWYKAQAELIAAFFPLLGRFDLAVMPYLSPDLTPARAATLPLIPFIKERYERTFAPKP